MRSRIGSAFREQIADVQKRLLSISEQESQTPYRNGGWSKKEILGHLIDSALNNHQRFVRASLDGSYEGPSYRQQEWVEAHGYSGMAWSTLFEHWQMQNDLLCEVVDRVPDNRLHAPCRIAENAPVTLEFLIMDYLVHLRHHADQIAG